MGPSVIGAEDPGVLRIKEISPDKFSWSYQEWDMYDKEFYSYAELYAGNYLKIEASENLNTLGSDNNPYSIS